MVSSSQLRKGDVVLVEEGELIPGDGEVIDGVAYVNEAAITGESAPVLKEPGTDIRSSVTGGTQVVSDRLRIRITSDPGESFLDRMIALVEGAVRQRTPNEIALAILLAALTIIFLLAVATLQPFAIYAGDAGGHGHPGRAAGLPHPDDHRRAAVGDRHRRHGPRHPLQRAGHVRPRGRGGRRHRHAAARQDRHDHLRQPSGRRVHPGRRRRRRPSWPPPRSGPAWATRRPRAARSSRWPSSTARRRRATLPDGAEVVPFTAETRMSGMRLDGRALCQGRRRRGPGLDRRARCRPRG